MRRAGRGKVIGPIVAQDLHTAKALVRHCLRQHPGCSVRVDSDPCLGMSSGLAKLRLAHVDTAKTMMRGPSAPNEMDYFGLASQAYG
ncbi:MAG: hypothetical protein ABJL72_18655 [Roseobacter sp.]